MATNSYSQFEAIEKKINKRDTVTSQTFSGDLDFLLQINHKQSYQHADIRWLNIGKINYLFNHTDVELDYRQDINRSDDGKLHASHYLLFSSGIHKYKPISEEKSVLRVFYPAPIFIFQNNDWRGLQWRFQAGMLFYPATFSRPKFKSDLGLGFVYDWSSWEVNNQKKIDASPLWLKEMILFVNSHSKLVNNMYMHHYEFRPMILLNLNYQLIDNLNINLITSYQQSLVSPFTEEIKMVYPVLAKIHPYIFSRLSGSVKVSQRFSLKSTLMVDYENNNLSMYDSSWGYNILFGVTWNFIWQKKM